MASKESSNSMEKVLLWKCEYCCYKNQAELQSCKVCRKTPSSEAEFLSKAEWDLREAEYLKKVENQNGSANSDINENFKKLTREYGLTEKGAEIVQNLINEGHAEKRAILAAKHSDTLEKAQEFCIRQSEREKRITDLLCDDVLPTYKKANMAVNLMDKGHDRIMAIHAAKRCDTLKAAEEFLQNVCQVGNQYFPIEKLQDCINKLMAENEGICKEKLELAAKLVLIGYDQNLALNSAEQFDTYEQAASACLKQQINQKRIQDLLQEEILPNEIKAEIAIKLMDHGYSKKDSILAARRCKTFDAALKTLETECYICMAIFPKSEMISMLYCPHSCCLQCTKMHFTISIREKNISDILCPFCNEPDLHNIDEEAANRYFVYLLELLKRIIEPNTYDILETKLRDYALRKDSDFIWCTNCKWDDDHQGKSCKEYEDIKSAQHLFEEQNDIRLYLIEKGIVCPKCDYQYELARGGCMHFTCTQCKHQFCCGCKKPFLVNDKCKQSPRCATMGLHCHHPRNCPYYLRDKDVDLLKQLLHENDIFIIGENENEDLPHFDKCPVMEQKETPTGYNDEICGLEPEKGQAGFCRKHYGEFLASLIVKNHLDPVWIMDINSLQVELTKNDMKIPYQNPRESDEEYTYRLKTIINEDIPLLDTDKTPIS